MANEKPGFGQKLNSIQNYGGFFGWIWGLATAYWPATTALLTGAAMSTLATLSERVSEWGAVGWGAVGIVTALLIYLVLTVGYSALGRGRQRAAEAKMLEIIAGKGPTSFNRLEPQFHKQQISLAELIHPLGEPLREKVFTDCEFYGPGLMGLSGSTIDGFGAGNAELIRLKNDRMTNLPTKAMMMNCHFIRCKFYNVVVAMTSDSVDQLRVAIPNIPVLGE